jgi:DNA repair protein RecO (recombination protein O)
MPYHLYSTEGIILKKKNFGEADTLLYILTKDLGLIIASARSTRVSKSKLKGSLQEFTLVTITVVRGKNGWKITSAVMERNFFFDLLPDLRKILAKMVLILLKMIQGEIPHKELYNIIHQGLKEMSVSSKEKLYVLEAVIILRVMSELGYVLPRGNIAELVKDKKDWNEVTIFRAEKNIREIISMVNEAIKMSQL